MYLHRYKISSTFLQIQFFFYLWGGLFTNFDSFIPMVYKKGLLISLISRYFNFALPMYFSILKWKNSRERSLWMVILQHLWIVVSNNLLIKCITLENSSYLLALYIFLSSFHWSSWFENSITTSEISFFFLSTYFLTCRVSSFFPSFQLLSI
jgi:hypothetical protein